jgi:hypothetical protein
MRGEITRQHYDDRIPPAAIDLHLDRESLDSIDRSGQNTGKHVCILGQHRRKGNADFDRNGESGARMDLLPRSPDQEMKAKNLALAIMCITTWPCR